MKAILIAPVIKREGKKEISLELEELERLCHTAYLETAGSMAVPLDRINSAFFIGRGKAEELKDYISEKKISLAVFNENLNSTQQRNLEKALGVDVIDKTFLILKIFRQRARTVEGKLQVEMARLKYGLSRISGFGEALDQQHGAIGGKGAGEKKIEYDRRALKDKIAFLKERLEKLRTQRAVQRNERQSVPMPQISIVGYTNAGKSTLLNALTGDRHAIYADDKLFATLDPTTKRVKLGVGSFVLVSDTVGFINRLPHTLIAAFRATLDEIKYSDLIINLRDLSSPQMEKQADTVKKTLEEIGAGQIPVINVFNKTDLVGDPASFKGYFSSYNPVFISAAKGAGLKELTGEIEKRLSRTWKTYDLKLPFKKHGLIGGIRKAALVTGEKYTGKGLELKILATESNYSKIKHLLKQP